MPRVHWEEFFSEEEIVSSHLHNLFVNRILHIYSCKVMLSITKYAMYKYPNLQRAITQKYLFWIYWKDNQVIYSSLPIHSSTFKGLASIVLKILCIQDFFILNFFSKSHNSEKGQILMRRKYVSASFSWQIHI